VAKRTKAMTIELEKNGESVHAGSLHAECGPDAEPAALANVEKAREEIASAEEEIVRAVHDLDEGEGHLKEAEAEFDEAKHHVVHFFVDGEEYDTREPKQTPNHIIREYGRRDPTNTTLLKSMAVRRSATRAEARKSSAYTTAPAFRSSRSAQPRCRTESTARAWSCSRPV
jgi:hypothetical protein